MPFHPETNTKHMEAILVRWDHKKIKNQQDKTHKGLPEPRQSLEFKIGQSDLDFKNKVKKKHPLSLLALCPQP